MDSDVCVRQLIQKITLVEVTKNKNLNFTGGGGYNYGSRDGSVAKPWLLVKQTDGLTIVSTVTGDPTPSADTRHACTVTRASKIPI